MTSTQAQVNTLLSTLSLKKWSKKVSDMETEVLREALVVVEQWLDRCPYVHLYQTSRAPCVNVLNHSELQELAELLSVEVEARESRATYLRLQKREWLYRNPHRTGEEFDREVAGLVESKPLPGTVQQTILSSDSGEGISYGRRNRRKKNTARHL